MFHSDEIGIAENHVGLSRVAGDGILFMGFVQFSGTRGRGVLLWSLLSAVQFVPSLVFVLVWIIVHRVRFAVR
jgi:hypothetical protein